MESSSLGAQLKSSRLSMGGRASDIAAVLAHQEMEDGVMPKFVEHVNNGDKKGTSEVKHVGTEVSPGPGFEHYFAFVNKRTGEVHWKPATLVQFQAVYKPSEEMLNGTIATPKTDYRKSFGDTEDKWAKRRRLTAEFGSLKKNKFMEASIRRRVEEESLAKMDTPTISNGKETKVMEDGTPNVSLLQQAESSVLPFPNLKATSPSEVYSFEQFLPENPEDAKLLREEAKNFFKEFNTLDKLKSCGNLSYKFTKILSYRGDSCQITSRYKQRTRF